MVKGLVGQVEWLVGKFPSTLYGKKMHCLLRIGLSGLLPIRPQRSTGDGVAVMKVR